MRALALISLVVASGCGSGEQSSQAKESEYLTAKLNIAQESKCNAQGLFYDNAAGGTTCGPERIAVWRCDRDGLELKLGVLADEKIEPIDELVDDGYEFHQCGELRDEAVAVVLYKYDEDEGEADVVTVRIQL